MLDTTHEQFILQISQERLVALEFQGLRVFIKLLLLSCCMSGLCTLGRGLGAGHRGCSWEQAEPGSQGRQLL